MPGPPCPLLKETLLKFAILEKNLPLPDKNLYETLHEVCIIIMDNYEVWTYIIWSCALFGYLRGVHYLDILRGVHYLGILRGVHYLGILRGLHYLGILRGVHYLGILRGLHYLGILRGVHDL